MRFQQFCRVNGAVALFIFAGAWAGEAQPHLVVDLNQQRVPALLPSQLSRGVEHGGVLYFSGQDPQHGRELWRTDGTAEGTYPLVDLCPGSCGGLGEPLGFFDGHLYFRGDDREHGVEIWRTDGTVGGEELLADLCPGACPTEPADWLEWRGAIWFLTKDQPGSTYLLWRSDGTAESTRPVVNLCTDLSICGLSPLDYPFSRLRPDPSGEGFLLQGSSPDSAFTSLFRTDGTAAGTVLLHRFAHEVQTAAEPFGPLYFLDGLDLWTNDGTPAGTRLVRSLDGLAEGVALSVRVVDGIFYAIFSSGDWLRSDGTAEGTIQLARLDLSFSYPRIARIGGTVFAVTGTGVWRTGGTPETTLRFEGPRGEVESVIEQPGRLFVMARDGRYFVWTFDGTGGVRRIHLAGPPPPDGEIAGFRDGVLISRGIRELWRIDGAGARGERVHDFQPENGGSGPVDQLVLGGRLLFMSLDGRSPKLFSSDGTASGTTALSAEPLYDFGFEYLADFYSLTRAGKRAFFWSASTLWTTDGSRAGTGPIYPSLGRPGLYRTAPIGFVGGRFLFGGSRSGSYPCDPGDAEPWVSDGTPDGTKRVIDLNPFFRFGRTSLCEIVKVSSSPGQGAVLGRIALFAADDLLHGRELFATDGTKAGTRLLADLNPSRQSNPEFYTDFPEFGPEQVGVGSDPSDLVRVGGTVFFVADDGRTGRELWVTNGTRRGTRLVVDLVPGPSRASSSPHDLVVVGDGIYFFASNPGGAAGEGLYKSDGTSAGTVRVSDLAGATQARDLTVAAGRLFFVAFRPESGTELWTSRGTAETTREVTDLRPGPRGSLPEYLKATAGRVVFAADDGVSGLEPWSSDGTAAGTVRLVDVAPGLAASTPGPFSIANGQVLFGADDGEHGRELWAIPMAELPQ
ncbi:MAG TPA: hypothetical protein VGS22_22510 [Thermoanaerobaculia bacterium]|jgi:ELWxxDGT repeat protein|nr:hypothetical protein [Thermoanaerobaculia bacterium]